MNYGRETNAEIEEYAEESEQWYARCLPERLWAFRDCMELESFRTSLRAYSHYELREVTYKITKYRWENLRYAIAARKIREWWLRKYYDPKGPFAKVIMDDFDALVARANATSN